MSKLKILYPYSLELVFEKGFSNALRQTNSAKKWCRENCIGLWTLENIHNANKPKTVWYFQKNEDLVQFKIFWGDSTIEDNCSSLNLLDDL